MKKILTAAIVLSSVFAMSVFSQELEKEQGFISVNSSLVKEVTPNQAEITFKIETSDISLKNASNANKQIANKVYSVLKSNLTMSDSLKTGQYSARPIYMTTKDNKRVLDKYLVLNTVVVKTKSIESVAKLIDIAVANGATGVDNLTFSASDYDSICNENLSALTKKTYDQANSIAQSINSQILGVKSINASCNQDNYARPYFALASKSLNDSAVMTPIESGKIKINLNVDASFYVK